MDTVNARSRAGHREWIGLAVGSMAAPALARRVRPAFVMGAGLVMATVGFGALSRLADTGVTGLVAGSSHQPASPPMTNERRCPRLRHGP